MPSYKSVVTDGRGCTHGIRCRHAVNRPLAPRSSQAHHSAPRCQGPRLGPTCSLHAAASPTPISRSPSTAVCARRREQRPQVLPLGPQVASPTRCNMGPLSRLPPCSPHAATSPTSPSRSPSTAVCAQRRERRPQGPFFWTAGRQLDTAHSALEVLVEVVPMLPARGYFPDPNIVDGGVRYAKHSLKALHLGPWTTGLTRHATSSRLSPCSARVATSPILTSRSYIGA